MSFHLVPCRRCGEKPCILVRDEVSIACWRNCGSRILGSSQSAVVRSWNAANEIRIPVGAAIRVARYLAGVGQVELAKATGISQGQLSKIENGTARLPSDFLGLAAKMLRVSTTTLCALADPTASNEEIGRAVRAFAKARGES